MDGRVLRPDDKTYSSDANVVVRVASMIARCDRCMAPVARQHLTTHRQYNCRPGLHQPPRQPGEHTWGATCHVNIGDIVVPVNDPGCLREVVDTHTSKPWIRVGHTAPNGRVVTSHWLDAAYWRLAAVCAGCDTTDPYDHKPHCPPAGDPRHPGDP